MLLPSLFASMCVLAIMLLALKVRRIETNIVAGRQGNTIDWKFSMACVQCNTSMNDFLIYYCGNIYAIKSPSYYYVVTWLTLIYYSILYFLDILPHLKIPWPSKYHCVFLPTHKCCSCIVCATNGSLLKLHAC